MSIDHVTTAREVRRRQLQRVDAPAELRETPPVPSRALLKALKGKAKEVVGAVTGRDDVQREGQAQQDKADAQRDAAKKEAEAESARGAAKVSEAREKAEQN